jgi:tRNA(Ile2) C34 agmatinyltransferase TiaS
MQFVVVYRIDDGTGVMDCWKYYDFGSFNTSRSLTLGDFVTVKGQLNVSQEYVSFFSI